MITKLRNQTQDEPSADYEHLVVIIEATDDGSVAHKYMDDEVAEVITIPGKMVQVIDMEGNRHDTHNNAFILLAEGDWRAWAGGAGTRELPDVNRIALMPDDRVRIRFADDRTLTYGTQINRVKRSTLCVT